MSKPYGTILIPLDTSAVSEEIVLPAAGLAQALHYELLLLHVVAPAASLIAISHPALLNPGLAERWEADALVEAHQYLTDVAQRVEKLGVPVRTTVRIAAESATAILACARENADMVAGGRDHHATIIAMTTHGQTGVRHWALGSIAEQVIHHTTVPLLLLRTQATSRSWTIPDTIRTILVPLDGSAFAEHALPLAQTIAAATGATLILVAVTPPIDDLGLANGGIEPLWLLAEEDTATQHARDTVESAAQELRRQGVTARTRLMAGDPAVEIVGASTTEHADMIVMATHGRSGFQRLMLGSVAQKVLHTAEQPLLLVRPAPSPPHPSSHHAAAHADDASFT